MRDIKFRQPLIRKGKFDSFHYWGFLSDGNYSSPSNDWVSQNKEYPSQQFTGLKDKNGKEIYEGDILKFSRYWQDHFQQEYTKIFWFEENACFQFSYDLVNEYQIGIIVKESEIIGNIYENAELLTPQHG